MARVTIVSNNSGSNFRRTSTVNLRVRCCRLGGYTDLQDPFLKRPKRRILNGVHFRDDRTPEEYL
jgi:hypothetical protein